MLGNIVKATFAASLLLSGAQATPDLSTIGSVSGTTRQWTFSYIASNNKKLFAEGTSKNTDNSNNVYESSLFGDDGMYTDDFFYPNDDDTEVWLDWEIWDVAEYPKSDHTNRKVLSLGSAVFSDFDLQNITGSSSVTVKEVTASTSFTNWQSTGNTVNFLFTMYYPTADTDVTTSSGHTVPLLKNGTQFTYTISNYPNLFSGNGILEFNVDIYGHSIDQQNNDTTFGLASDATSTTSVYYFSTCKTLWYSSTSSVDMTLNHDGSPTNWSGASTYPVSPATFDFIEFFIYANNTDNSDWIFWDPGSSDGGT
jgi:hypothetical protein